MLDTGHDARKIAEQFLDFGAADRDASFRKIHFGVVVEEVEEWFAAIQAAQVFQRDRFALLIRHSPDFHDVVSLLSNGSPARGAGGNHIAKLAVI